jgi:flagellar basal-body rod protein FlgB
MDVLDNYFGVHAQALELRSKRLELLASNIANAATPGYKARDIDFAAQLKAAESGGGALTVTAGNHIGIGGPGGGSGAAGGALYRIPNQASLDGNTVELSTEQTRFGENAVQYQTTLAFLNGRINTLSRALKGE